MTVIAEFSFSRTAAVMEPQCELPQMLLVHDILAPPVRVLFPVFISAQCDPKRHSALVMGRCRYFKSVSVFWYTCRYFFQVGSAFGVGIIKYRDIGSVFSVFTLRQSATCGS